MKKKRQNFSDKTRAEAFLVAKGFCAKCQKKIAATEVWHADHINPDFFEGRNDLENCQVLCVPCHKDKTKTDRKDIAKSNRMQKIANGERGRKRKGPPMMGTKASGWKKPMNGKAHRRQRAC